ncbi:MAG: hypothetical protein HQL07_18380 [Nitrospirae bacterium]|nr:hypothetical protein [Magnetococcales bacterium]
MNTPIPNLPSDSNLLQEMVLELSMEWREQALEWSDRERKLQEEKQALQLWFISQSRMRIRLAGLIENRP